MKKNNSIKNVKRDILIIGAGPAGLSLACSLADTNLKITVIEKQSVKHLSSPSYDGREIALTHFSKKILKNLGVWKRIPSNFISPIKEAKVLDGNSSYALHFDSNKVHKEALGYLVSNHIIKKALYKEAITPSVEIAYEELGKEIADLWVFGTAKNLLDHYFTSEKSKLYMGMTVIESGPASIHDPGTAFTIPLMDSGSVFDGYWGFVKTGIWKITEALSNINLDLGVKIYLNSSITEIDTTSKIISFVKDSKDEKLKYEHLIFATDPVTPSKLINGIVIQVSI